MSQIPGCICEEVKPLVLPELIPFVRMKGGSEDDEIAIKWNPKCPAHPSELLFKEYDPYEILRIQEEKIKNAKPIS